MIVYSSNKKQFGLDVLSNQIEKIVLNSYVKEMGSSVNESQKRAWRESLDRINNVINDPEIPNNAGIAIEYKIPQSAKRIDFIITGISNENKKYAVIVELKQWSKAEITPMDGIVSTFVGGRVRDESHPSYQVWSYAMLLEDFNANIQNNSIALKPCAYLHNYELDDVIRNDFYKPYTDKAPVFLMSDALRLRAFIKRFIQKGDNGTVLYDIENGIIKPSKALADCLESMLNGNQEFVLIDDQKLVYEKAVQLTKKSTSKNKNVLIVKGGPGTGKSVVAINLLTAFTKMGKLSQYVTKNSAPREVYQIKLSGSMRKSRIQSLFCSSGSFYSIKSNYFDALIVDEAHRLVAKGGIYSNLGENQVKELINTSKCTIFFIDEDQKVTLKDIGSIEEIKKWSSYYQANVHEIELTSQFRCNGSDGYLAWIDSLLQIRETANNNFDEISYDFKIYDNPASMHEDIIKLNRVNKNSRMLAGYCWNWKSKKFPHVKDILIDDYAATWNLSEQGQAWLIHPDSVSEVGCIHTCQGLDLTYAGVIIGPDLIVRNGEIITDATKRASTDKSIFGYKKQFQDNPDSTKKLADQVIKNTYRTLMTRGLKGCYVYSVDPETQEYLKFCLTHSMEKPFS